jgi:hypothetical protein
VSIFNKLSIALMCALKVSSSFCAVAQHRSYYPSHYLESRERFLGAVSALEGELGDQLEKDSFQAKKHQGSQLFSDFVYLDCRKNSGGENPLVVLTSGVHGPEAKVGAAAQIWFLENESKKRCKQGLSQVFFHALNPFGYHHDRRFTANNVDLNRNFPTTGDIYDTENSAYSTLESILNPKKPVGPLLLRSTVLFKKLLGKLVGGLDTAAIRQASVGGQYQYPQGIYFGGHRPEPIVYFVKEKLSEVFENHNEVLHYDFHTGLGEEGVLHMIVGPELTSYGKDKINKVFMPLSHQGTETRYKLTTADDPGFYKVEGDIIDYVSSLKSDGKIVSFTVEYGTVGLGLFSQLKTITRLVNENQGHFHGYKNDRVKKKVKARLRDVFHPPKRSWLDKVEGTNTYLLTTVLERFMASLK